MSDNKQFDYKDGFLGLVKDKVRFNSNTGSAIESKNLYLNRDVLIEALKLQHEIINIEMKTSETKGCTYANLSSFVPKAQA